jgi:demethylmenaquinone methyltransferase/2-methoxy-6-polyprenyl-1,4-benzoquinol methylase
MEVSDKLDGLTLSNQAKTVQNMFDRIAPRYDFLNRLLSMRQDVRWRQFMCRRLPRVGTKKVGATPVAAQSVVAGHEQSMKRSAPELSMKRSAPELSMKRSAPELSMKRSALDIACGTGDVMLEIRRSRPDYRRIVGLDLSRQMLACAAQRMDAMDKLERTQQEPLMELVHGTATSLPFAANSFDAVTISFGLRNVDDRALALREMARVLRPGGRLFVLEFFPLERSLFGSLFEFYFRHILPRIGAVFSDGEAYRYLPDSVASMPVYSRFVKDLHEAGLVATYSRSWLFGGCRLVEAMSVGKFGNT